MARPTEGEVSMGRLTWKCDLDGMTDVGLRDGVTVGDAICRLADIESILGDEYSIDHLRELVQRDTAQRCKAQIINRGMDVTGEYDIDYNLICPSCGAVVGDAEYNELNGPFCHKCGQRLDLLSEEAEAAPEGSSQ